MNWEAVITGVVGAAGGWLGSYFTYRRGAAKDQSEETRASRKEQFDEAERQRAQLFLRMFEFIGLLEKEVDGLKKDEDERERKVLELTGDNASLRAEVRYLREELAKRVPQEP